MDSNGQQGSNLPVTPSPRHPEARQKPAYLSGAPAALAASSRPPPISFGSEGNDAQPSLGHNVDLSISIQQPALDVQHLNEMSISTSTAAANMLSPIDLDPTPVLLSGAKLSAQQSGTAIVARQTVHGSGYDASSKQETTVPQAAFVEKDSSYTPQQEYSSVENKSPLEDTSQNKDFATLTSEPVKISSAPTESLEKARTLEPAARAMGKIDDETQKATQDTEAQQESHFVPEVTSGTVQGSDSAKEVHATMSQIPVGTIEDNKEAVLRQSKTTESGSSGDGGRNEGAMDIELEQDDNPSSFQSPVVVSDDESQLPSLARSGGNKRRLIIDWDDENFGHDDWLDPLIPVDAPSPTHIDHTTKVNLPPLLKQRSDSTGRVIVSAVSVSSWRKRRIVEESDDDDGDDHNASRSSSHPPMATTENEPGRPSSDTSSVLVTSSLSKIDKSPTVDTIAAEDQELQRRSSVLTPISTFLSSASSSGPNSPQSVVPDSHRAQLRQNDMRSTVSFNKSNGTNIRHTDRPNEKNMTIAFPELGSHLKAGGIDRPVRPGKQTPPAVTTTPEVANGGKTPTAGSLASSSSSIGSDMGQQAKLKEPDVCSGSGSSKAANLLQSITRPTDPRLSRRGPSIAASPKAPVVPRLSNTLSAPNSSAGPEPGNGSEPGPSSCTGISESVSSPTISLAINTVHSTASALETDQDAGLAPSPRHIRHPLPPKPALAAVVSPRLPSASLAAVVKDATLALPMSTPASMPAQLFLPIVQRKEANSGKHNLKQHQHEQHPNHLPQQQRQQQHFIQRK
ncbi:hypothetical protein BGZ58_007745 [Dissophora ornata]|nr:hypothetical protein BGZ58_007745 [Dissophora ornata]